MKPCFHPRLIHDPFCDPGLFIPFRFQKRALMFDLGELCNFPPRELLKITHVFVTHTHMDHFIGFDTLLRILLGRGKTLHLFGPPGFFQSVEGKLAGYTWNLVHEYADEFALQVNETHPDKVLSKTYLCRNRFAPGGPILSKPFSGKLVEEPAFFVEASLLDHRIPCLGLSLTENFYINILKEGLKDLGLPVGPWLNLFKKAIYHEQDAQSEFVVRWKESGGTIREKVFILGDLMRKIAKISPGQKITYIADVVGSSANFEKMIELARGADHLFIEAAFLHNEKEVAAKKYHLTAKEAGEVAGKAGAKHLHLFHFSPRYRNRSADLEREAKEAYLDGADEP